MKPVSASALYTFIARFLVLLIIWWALTLGDPSGRVMGVLVVLPVVLISLHVFPPGPYRLRLLASLQFAGFFLIRSVVAGVDVARRLLSPTLAINPGELTVTSRLPAEGARALLANTLSLMPGTLSVNLHGDQLRIHCLDIDAPVEQDVRVTEERIAKLFGLQIPLQEEAA